MPWTDRRAGKASAMCISFEPNGRAICGGFDCTNRVTAEYGESLWHLIHDDCIHYDCQEPLADALGFKSWRMLCEHARRVVNSGQYKRAPGQRGGD